MLSTFRNIRKADRLLRKQEGGSVSDSESESSSAAEFNNVDDGDGSSVEDVDSQPDSIDLENYRDRLR